LWAQMKLADLETDADANAAAIGDLGRRFNLVTSNTSLLVLETLQQYVQYGIVPPTSRKEIFTQFVEQLKQTKDQKTQAQKQRLDEVEKEWKQRVAWWEKEYKYDPKFVYHEKGQELQQRGMGTGSRAGVRAGTSPECTTRGRAHGFRAGAATSGDTGPGQHWRSRGS